MSPNHPWLHLRAALLAFATVALAGASPPDARAQEIQDPWRAMETRNIGPAGMSGRVTAIDVDLSDRNRIFVGAASGGVWRSENGGTTWHPVFDDQPVLSIGDVVVSRANPDLVWAGTGEGNPRQSVSVGRGVYRSLDGGDSWEHRGLEDTERIARVVAHPTDPDVVFVGAMGPLWSDGEARGVFRSTDGGETWEKTLYVDERTGVADLVMDPANPDKLFAAMYTHRRWPWFFESGGEGSGVYMTVDGGDNWTELGPEHGFPEGPLGRIGLAISPSSRDVVYALVEAEQNALLRSGDGGSSWEVVNDEEGINPRPMYYADLRLDPKNENRLYRLAGALDVSEDGGRTWENVVPSRIIHGDHHALWIDPDNPRHMISGNDGGLGISYDQGGTWRFVENLPLAQFYQLSIDDAHPFHVAGGVQDSGSWIGPSAVWHDRGIMNAHWRRVNGADGFATLVDPSNPRFGYTTSQNGNLLRFDRETMERRRIRPPAPEGEAPDEAGKEGDDEENGLRFNWNSALAVDVRDSTTIYFGSQYVHRSRDGGESWEIISPDLTTGDPGKQAAALEDRGLGSSEIDNHTTILAIDTSPLEPGLIWAVTDDGNVQVTRDDGGSWTNVADGLEGAPDSAYVPEVKASRHRAGRAYVVVDDHRRGDMGAYAYRTDDYGESWERLPTEGVDGFLHDVEEDPVEPNLLFLGSEMGMYVSLDAGESWFRWTGLPAVPVREVLVHPREHDLAIGTHGRAAWIVDDIRPLRAAAADPGVLESELHVFEAPPAQQHEVALESDLGVHLGYRVVGEAMFFGENRPYGALVSYWVGEGAAASADGPARIEVRDAGGTVVRHLEGTTEPGLNRIVWDLHPDEPEEAEGEEDEGDDEEEGEVAPGRYEVTVRVGDREERVTVEVVADPRKEGTEFFITSGG